MTRKQTAIKDIIRTIREIGIWTLYINSIISVLNILIRQVNYGYVIKNLVIEKYTLKDPRERATMYAMSSQSVQKK